MLLRSHNSLIKLMCCPLAEKTFKHGDGSHSSGTLTHPKTSHPKHYFYSSNTCLYWYQHRSCFTTDDLFWGNKNNSFLLKIILSSPQKRIIRRKQYLYRSISVTGRSLSYYSLKVHSFLKQCLKDLHLTQFGGTFSWCQVAGFSLKISWKYPQIVSSEVYGKNN